MYDRIFTVKVGIKAHFVGQDNDELITEEFCNFFFTFALDFRVILFITSNELDVKHRNTCRVIVAVNVHIVCIEA